MRFLRLGPSGIRGAVGSALTAQLAIKYASAFGTWLDGGTVGVAIDTRTSSPMFKSACFAGLLATGCNVVDFGIRPAPVLHFAVKKLGLDGAMLIGGGHHQGGWNAVMPFSKRGTCLTPLQSQEMLDIYHGGVFRSAGWNHTGRITVAPQQIALDYVEDLAKLVNADAIASRKFRVVADFCNGSGSVLSHLLADRFGLDLVPINDLLSGSLPHDPEPRPRSSAQVKSIMKPLRADIGFVFSSDVGRTAVVTDSGETLSEEYSFPIVADHVLQRAGKGAGVVSNCCTTRTLDDIVRMRGGVLHKGKVGQAHTIDKMFETGSVLAGDGSGSIALARGVPGFDSFLLMALVLESMAFSGESSSQIAARLPRYYIIKRAVPCSSSHAYSILRSLRGRLFPDAEFSEEDGLRFDWEDGWVHLRASMTEPIVRMIVEWKGREKAEEHAAKVYSIIERVVAS